MRTLTKAVLLPLAAILTALGTVGCPPPDTQSEYDRGFLDGFNEDDWYWEGFLDSWDTEDNPIYQGDEIPFFEEPPYDAGYWDGVWYAYHDGFFVSYKFGFIVGFSEGYDNAYWEDFLDFLDLDEHIELLNGGFLDGYHDGFTEGRVFGAADFEAGIDFDWLGALLEYESGVDLYFEEVDVGTGEFSPATFYEWGTDPNDLTKSLRKANPRHPVPTLRGRLTKDINVDELELYRPIPADIQNLLDIHNDTSLRDGSLLLFEDTWLDRIEEYLSVAEKRDAEVRATKAAGESPRATGPRARVTVPTP